MSEQSISKVLLEPADTAILVVIVEEPESTEKVLEAVLMSDPETVSVHVLRLACVVVFEVAPLESPQIALELPELFGSGFVIWMFTVTPPPPPLPPEPPLPQWVKNNVRRKIDNLTVMNNILK